MSILADMSEQCSIADPGTDLVWHAAIYALDEKGDIPKLCMVILTVPKPNRVVGKA